MKKYYYTDALKAAWMAREFAFKIHQPETEEYQESKLALSELLNEASNQESGFMAVYEPPYYIHPDCHKILEPQEGDKGSDSSKPEYLYIFLEGSWHSLNGIKLKESGNINIIRRDEKAFFAPEIEETE